MTSDDQWMELTFFEGSADKVQDQASSLLGQGRRDFEEADHSNSFWDSVRAFEGAPPTTHLEQLQLAGLAVPPTELLDEAELAAKLEELARALAQMNVFLKHTEHLSDRNLYELLYWDVLRRETVDTSQMPGTHCFLDLLGDRTGENLYLYLIYYANAQERRFWVEQFPDETIPQQLAPPYVRDWGYNT